MNLIWLRVSVDDIVQEGEELIYPGDDINNLFRKMTMCFNYSTITKKNFHFFCILKFHFIFYQLQLSGDEQIIE